MLLVGRPKQYQQDSPALEAAQVVGCYSVDEDRNFGHDRSLLKFIEPQYLTKEGKIRVNFDLNRGWGKNSPYTSWDEESIHNLYQWILNNSDTLINSEATPPRY